MREGIALYRAGKYKAALDAFLSSSVESKDYPVFSYHVGLCYVQLKKYEEALLYLEQVVGSDIDYARMYQTRMIIGYIYSLTQRLRLSIFEFKKLLEEGYESAKVYTALGHVLFLDKKMDESLESLEKALSLEPENPGALNSMGYVLAEAGNKLDLAYRYCSRALRAKPGNPAYLDSFAWVLFKQGKINEALAVLKKALELAPDNVIIAEHLNTVRKFKYD